MNYRILSYICVLYSLFSISLSEDKILILPIHTAESIQDIETINLLFLESFHQFSSDKITYGDTLSPCDHFDCALKTVKEQDQDKIVFQSIKPLGGKMIYTAMMLSKDGTDKRHQRVFAESIEDFANITLRVADALVNNKTLEDVADVENILEGEAESEPNVRKALNRFGFSLGYIYPIGSSFPKNNCGIGCASPNYSQMFRYHGFYSYEMQNRRASLNAGFHWFMPSVIGADFTWLKYLNDTDYSPFFGGGIGIFGVGGGDSYADKRNSGFGLNLQAGYVLLRTYDINLIIRGSFIQIFNTDMDNGIGLEIGTATSPSEFDPYARNRKNGLTTLGVVILLLILISQ